MSDNASLSLEVKSHLGRATYLQVLSALMIFGSLALPLNTMYGGQSIFLIVIGIQVIGFAQMLITRAILQKEDYGVSAAFYFSFLTLLFSFMAGFFYLLVLLEFLNGYYFILIGIVNTILLVLLGKIRMSR